MKYTLSLLLFSLLFLACSGDHDHHHHHDTQLPEAELKLWYEQAAEDWMQEALPIGNAYLAAMFFGGAAEERIQFNEESLWSGGKGEWEAYNGGNRPGAYQYLPKVRQLLQEGNYEEAHALARKELTGVIKANEGDSRWVGYGAYQSFGELYIRPALEGAITNYRRELDIREAVGRVHFEAGGVKHERTYFASYPKRALVFRFANDAQEGLAYEIQLNSLHQERKIRLEGNELIMEGTLSNNGMAFESRMKIDAHGAQVSLDNGLLQVQTTQKLDLYLTAATDYENEYPHYTGRDLKKLNQETIANLAAVTYDQMLAEHIKDYQTLFSRVTFNLPTSETSDLSTDQRLQAYQDGGQDPALEALYFQYGRYLLISSSRPGSLPANLQGKWNHINNPPWASDYHANINIQMIYWPAEVTNLSEVHEPLIEYIDRLRAPGRQSAKDFFNARGWIVNTMNNTFGFTAPGWDFPWGFFPAGAAWYGQHVWQHYEYNLDRAYLENKAYPILKEAALFWLDYLTPDEDGQLVSSPSYSPEHGGISTGAYMDIQIVWNLFSNTIQALDILGIEPDFKAELTLAKEKLLPLRIGSWGQLQEWKEDLDDPENKHRHLSHLFALYPGKQISALETPELAEAARTSLVARGNEGTGWSIGWKINFWARLYDGDGAYAMLRRALKLTGDKSVNMSDGGGVYANLFSTHPPFQLDGNMGVTAGVAEMLMQSHAGVIELLPALPESWSDGSIKGLKARGGVEVDLSWADGQLVQAKVRNVKAGSYRLKYKENETTFSALSGGQEMNWDGQPR